MFRANDLRVHLKWHLNIRDYKCSVCPESFVTKGSLELHLKRHHGDKRYQCEICNERFIHAGALKKHQASHEQHQKRWDFFFSFLLSFFLRILTMNGLYGKSLSFRLRLLASFVGIRPVDNTCSWNKLEFFWNFKYLPKTAMTWEVVFVVQSAVFHFE